MSFVKTFKQILKSDVSIAGGKGASLGEMTNAGIPVPPGFVVLVSAFERFLEETDLKKEIETTIKEVNHKDINSIDRTSNEIRDLIRDAVFPNEVKKEIIKEFAKLKAKYVAVRSSATAEDSSSASWAGELESYLNVNKNNLLESVKKCWASLFTPRAIFYRFEKKLNNKEISVAVVVQEMAVSEVSGVCFTVHPVTKDKNQMIIEAGYGLGEAIVGGMITSDTYIIRKLQITNYKLQINSKSQIPNNKCKFEILEVNVPEQKMMIVRSKNGTQEKVVPKEKQEKQKLPGREIIKLAEICREIEDHYKKPQDIEWVFEKGKFYIVQSRPITTL